MSDINCGHREIDFSKSHYYIEGELVPAEFLIDLLINNPLFLDGKTTDEKSVIEMEKREETETDTLSISSSDDSNHVTEVSKEETRRRCLQYDRDILLKIRQFQASLAKFELHDHLLEQDWPYTCLRVVANTKPLVRGLKKKDKALPKPLAIFREPVELHRSENPWRPTIIMHMKNKGFKGLSSILSSNPHDQIKQISLWKKQKALGILNKITFKTFEKLCTKFLKLENISTNDEIVIIIVKKTISEEKYCALYVTLLNKMINNNNQQKSSIRKKILDQFEIEFNWIIEQILKLQKVEREISSSGGSNTCLEYAKQFKLTTEKKMALKENCSSLMKAIGELHKSNLVANQTIVRCIRTLMETTHDLGYTSICLLLTYVGEKLERVSKEKLPPIHFQSEFLNTIFSKLEQLANENLEISWSTLCAILNVIDFRNSGWKKTVIPETPPIEPTLLQESNESNESNGIDGNWRQGKNIRFPPKREKKNRKRDNHSELKNDIQGEIVYRRFRPIKENVIKDDLLNFERM